MFVCSVTAAQRTVIMKLLITFLYPGSINHVVPFVLVCECLLKGSFGSPHTWSPSHFSRYELVAIDQSLTDASAWNLQAIEGVMSEEDFVDVFRCYWWYALLQLTSTCLPPGASQWCGASHCRWEPWKPLCVFTLCLCGFSWKTLPPKVQKMHARWIGVLKLIESVNACLFCVALWWTDYPSRVLATSSLMTVKTGSSIPNCATLNRMKWI